MSETTETPPTGGTSTNGAGRAVEKAGSLWAELGPSIAFILTYVIMGRFPDDNGVLSGDKAIFWATGALMIGTAIVIAMKLRAKQKIPPMLLISGSIVGVFGALTIILQNQFFAYIKPTIINAAFAVLIFGSLAVKRNVWKMLFSHVFSLPDFAWRTLAIRWGFFFIALALWNEYLWRTYCPQPAEYSFLGLTFGAKDAEPVWAWWKLGNIAIVFVWGVINTPYTLKHLQEDDKPADAAS